MVFSTKFDEVAKYSLILIFSLFFERHIYVEHTVFKLSSILQNDNNDIERRHWPKDLNQRCSQSCYCNRPKVILILINTTKRTETERESMTETKHDKNKILMVQKRKRGIDFMLLIEHKKIIFHNFLLMFSFTNVNCCHIKFEVEFCMQICIDE